MFHMIFHNPQYTYLNLVGNMEDVTECVVMNGIVIPTLMNLGRSEIESLIGTYAD